MRNRKRKKVRRGQRCAALILMAITLCMSITTQLKAAALHMETSGFGITDKCSDSGYLY